MGKMKQLHIDIIESQMEDDDGVVDKSPNHAIIHPIESTNNDSKSDVIANA